MGPSFLARCWPWVCRHRLELVLALLFLGVSVQYLDKAQDQRSAVQRWRNQILDLDEGENIYREHVHPNPPITALLLRPLMELPPVAGAMLWFFLKAGMALLVIRWVFRMVAAQGMPFPFWAQALAVALSIRPIVGDLTHGNINLLILFLVVAALHAFGRGRELVGGALLGLAIAAKVSPLLFVPYFLYKRAWRMLAGCGVGLVLFTWLVPGLVLGWEQNAELFTSWRQQMIDPFLLGGKVVYSEHHNQSLPGLAARLATESPSFVFFDGSQPCEWWYHNLLALDPRLADWLFVKTALLVYGVAVLWSCRTPTQPRPGWRLAAEFSLVLLGMLIFNERTWKHHCVVLVVPFSVLAYYLATCRPGPRLRGYLVATLAGALLLMSLTSTSLMGRELGKLGQVYGAYLWAHVLLAAALVVILRSAAKPAARTAAGEAAGEAFPILKPARAAGGQALSVGCG